LSRRVLTSNPAMIERFGDPFRPLEADCSVVQFDQPLSEELLVRAGRLLADRPDVELYVHGRAGRTLDLLAHFPTVQRLHVALYELEDIAGLVHVDASLRSLTLGSTKRRFSLADLPPLPRLERLFLVGHARGIGVLRERRGLRSLGLSGITLPDLAILESLTSLQAFSLFLGSTRDLGALRSLPALEDLFLMRITKLADLSVLSDLVALKTLRLDWMRNVETLPSLAKLVALRDITLDTMKGLTDLGPVAAAPRLERLFVRDTPQLTPESFRAFLGHPTLREISAFTGRSRVNDAVKRMFAHLAPS
jgi:hypothetical protein